LALLGVFAALAGCEFTPVYGPSGAAEVWQNTVTVNAPDNVLGFRLAGRLGDVLGEPTAARFILDVKPQAEDESATIAEDGDITRFNLIGKATWVLTDLSGVQVTEGLVQTFTSYSATGSTVATQAAETDAESRLAIALADLIVQQLLTQDIAQ
jgi:LPS-assembly lipoprotein